MSPQAPALRVVRSNSGPAPDPQSAPERADPMLAQPRANGVRQAEPAAQAPPTRRLDDMSVDDWNMLFRAVETRLQRSMSDAPTGRPRQTARSTVLECVQSLMQLHSALDDERGRHERIERELHEVQSALMQVRGELSDTQASECRARHLALHDSLTRLPNRKHFRDRVDRALLPPEPVSGGPAALAVLYLDLDGFKPVNDRHGHAVGDEVLRIVGERLARSVRAGDMVCRMGGDEFACLLNGVTHREHLGHLAGKLFDTLSAPIEVDALEISVRPSIGIAMCPGDGIDTDALLRHADAAMYRAKREQLGHAFHDRRSDR